MKVRRAATAFAACAAVLCAACASAGGSQGEGGYFSRSFAPGIAGRATGFFHVEKTADGRWWAIDPIGRGFVPMGVDLVRSNGFKSRTTGRSAYNESILRKSGSLEAWRTNTVSRLKSWGFNTLGARSDRKLERRGFAHVISLSIGLSMCGDDSDESLWICPYENHPSRAFPNVFDEAFAVRCDEIAAKACAPNRDDQWLFGYFTDNELAWWGRGAKGSCDGLFDAVMAKPESHSAKKALRAFLAERGVADDPSAEVKLDFLRLAADRYFKTVCAAIRRHDPNHLVLGARFAGPDGAHDAVWECAGKYCDIVSFNFYAWVDLDRNAVRVASDPFSRTAADEIARRYAAAKRPLFITEWSFPALDSALPCSVGAGQRFRTQAERAAACELFAKTVLSAPPVVGYDYFMWVDEPADGLNEQFMENCNYGLVDENDEPYREVTSMFARIQSEAGKMRMAEAPEPKAGTVDAGVKHGKFLSILPAPSKGGGVAFAKDGENYRVSTRGGLVLSGRIGGDAVFSRVSLNGRDLGSIGIQADFDDESIKRRPMTNVTRVAFKEWRGWGCLALSGVGTDTSGADALRVDAGIFIHPDKPYFTLNVIRVWNISGRAAGLKALYFSQTPDFMQDASLDAPGRVPNLAMPPYRDGWVDAAGGAWWGGMTLARACTLFRYYILAKDGTKSCHSVVRFNFPPESRTDPATWLRPLPSGESFEAGGRIWALFCAGEGGAEAMVRGLTAFFP